jgi:drug/metabolite transporter (DMT)-like permease
VNVAARHAWNARSGIGARAVLLLVAALLGGNAVSAQIALAAGMDVTTAVALRSLVAALLAVPLAPRCRTTARQRCALALVCALIGAQSLGLYASLTLLPVTLVVLSFNTYPLWIAGLAWFVYRQMPPRALWWAMPAILAGLALALHAPPAVAAVSLAGLGLALGASLAFAGALVLTQFEVASLDGRFRSGLTMGVVGAAAVLLMLAQGGPHWPSGAKGWWALAAMCLLYACAFTLLFTVLPRLGVVGQSPMLNIEPVAVLLLAWLFLGQHLLASQLVGVVIVVAAVFGLGLSRRTA